MAAAQAAHAASLAGKFWPVDEQTYIIILGHDDIDYLDMSLVYLDHYLTFREPDLDMALTAIATFNPPENTFSNLSLWGGGETNGS